MNILNILNLLSSLLLFLHFSFRRSSRMISTQEYRNRDLCPLIYHTTAPGDGKSPLAVAHSTLSQAIISLNPSFAALVQACHVRWRSVRRMPLQVEIPPKVTIVRSLVGTPPVHKSKVIEQNVVKVKQD